MWKTIMILSIDRVVDSSRKSQGAQKTDEEWTRRWEYFGKTSWMRRGISVCGGRYGGEEGGGGRRRIARRNSESQLRYAILYVMLPRR
jgi:hypothetical protein